MHIILFFATITFFVLVVIAILFITETLESIFKDLNKSVFILQLHSEDVKIIGIYSSHEKAKRTMDLFKNTKGFEDAPDNFHIDEYRLDQDHWNGGYGQ